MYVYNVANLSRSTGCVWCIAKALSTLATMVAEIGDYSRQCGQGLMQ